MLIGNEGAGLSEELLEMADVRVTIPCPGKVESLNAAVAGSLLLYEASRQRAAKCRGIESETQIPFGKKGSSKQSRKRVLRCAQDDGRNRQRHKNQMRGSFDSRCSLRMTVFSQKWIRDMTRHVG